MEKSKLILLGIVILLLGLVSGWFLASYSLNTKLSQSEAAKIRVEGGSCSGCIDADGDSVPCSSSCKASQGNCISTCGGKWTTAK
jgi:hypothetical protein